MHEWPRKISIWRKPRYIPLQYRFIFLSSGLVTLLLATVALVVSYQQGLTIRYQVERRGLAIAQSLAATSKAALTTYNYISLSQSANQAAQDPDLAYVIIHDKEGRVAGYSGQPEFEGKFLTDALSQSAVSSSVPLVQTGSLEATRTPILDIAVPVAIQGSERPWGVVRVALSLGPMHRQIRQVQLTIGGIGVLALAPAVLVCVWLARRIANPVSLLANATIIAAQGNLNQEIRITTGDEVEVLADNFSTMIREILQQRRLLERQLQEITGLQGYLNKLLTTMSDGLLSVDMEGRMVTANPAACKMLDVPMRAFECGEDVGSALEKAPELLEYLRGAIESPSSAGQKEIQVALGQEVKDIIVASSILTDKVNDPKQVIINLHDVTALKKLEARIRQTERLAALGTLSAGMAHEIRNPLSAIKTFVQLLPRKMDKPGFLEKFQRTVPRELERINRLIEDLLELARSPKYRFEMTDIGSILNQALDLLEEDLLSHRIQCRCELPEEMPLAWADGDQIAKAFHNIIRNAVQAMPSGGVLRIRALIGPLPDGLTVSQEGRQGVRTPWLTIAFSDTGVGMGPEEIKNIFNPFFTMKDSGTGLGLAITHKVITEHGGHIEVDSAPGMGACFSIHLPLKEACKADRFSATATT